MHTRVPPQTTSAEAPDPTFFCICGPHKLYHFSIRQRARSMGTQLNILFHCGSLKNQAGTPKKHGGMFQLVLNPPPLVLSAGLQPSGAQGSKHEPLRACQICLHVHAVHAWVLLMSVVPVCRSNGAPEFETLRAGRLRLLGRSVWPLFRGNFLNGLELKLPSFGMSLTVDKLKLNLLRHRQRFVPDVGAQF